jgi:hypothetical protein
MDARGEDASFVVCIALILAFPSEGVTEDFFGPLFKALAEATGIALLGDLRYVAALLGVALCVAYRLDLLLAAGFEAEVPMVGYSLTGVVIGRGSSFLHQFVEQFFPGRAGKGVG